MRPALRQGDRLEIVHRRKIGTMIRTTRVALKDDDWLGALRYSIIIYTGTEEATWLNRIISQARISTAKMDTSHKSKPRNPTKKQAMDPSPRSQAKNKCSKPLGSQAQNHLRAHATFLHRCPFPANSPKHLLIEEIKEPIVRPGLGGFGRWGGLPFLLRWLLQRCRRFLGWRSAGHVAIYIVHEVG